MSSTEVGPGIPIPVGGSPRPLFRPRARVVWRSTGGTTGGTMDGTTKVITGIVESTRKEGRYVVAVDGRPAHTVSLDIIDQLKLRVGGAVDAAGEAALEGAAAALQTYDRALN